MKIADVEMIEMNDGRIQITTKNSCVLLCDDGTIQNIYSNEITVFNTDKLYNYQTGKRARVEDIL